jgi:hypothetical protein
MFLLQYFGIGSPHMELGFVYRLEILLRDLNAEELVDLVDGLFR